MKKRKNLNNSSLTDEDYMTIALKEAKKAFTKDEVPVGAVLVSEKGEIIAKAHNTSEFGKSALEHAEINVLNKASQKLSQVRLWETTLYVTIEPCTMCAAAISIMRIKRLVFGAENKKGGAVINGVKFFDSSSCFHKPEIVSQILEEESSNLMSQFFQNKRKLK